MNNQLSEIAEEVERSGDVTGTHLSFAGDLSGIEVFGDLVLVMTYAEPQKTAGGIWKPETSLEEARFQGKSGLVLAIGPQAFQDDSRSSFGGQEVEVGDWVMYRPSDGLEFYKKTGSSKGVSCRLVPDVCIKAKLSDPSLVW